MGRVRWGNRGEGDGVAGRSEVFLRRMQGLCNEQANDLRAWGVRDAVLILGQAMMPAAAGEVYPSAVAVQTFQPVVRVRVNVKGRVTRWSGWPSTCSVTAMPATAVTFHGVPAA